MTAEEKDTRIHLVAELEALLPTAGGVKAQKLRVMIAEARRGEYHDFKSPHACGKMFASARLRDAGCQALATRLEEGEFDERADEEDRAEMALELKDEPALRRMLKLPDPGSA